MNSPDMRQNEGFFANAAATIKATQQAVNTGIDAVTEPFLRDGMLAAAFRQGTGELYEALKPFPQSIQVDEPGTLLNLQAHQAVPSEIARDDSPAPPDPGREHGHDMGRGR